MKFKVIQGGKKQSAKKAKDSKKEMEDYYAKERPRAQEMEKAEGDEEIVNSALTLEETRRRRKARDVA